MLLCIQLWICDFQCFQVHSRLFTGNASRITWVRAPCEQVQCVVSPSDDDESSRRQPRMLCFLPARDLFVHLKLTFSPSLRHCATGIVFPTNEFTAPWWCADCFSVPFLRNWITVSNDHVCPVSPTVAFSPQEDKSVYCCGDSALLLSMLWLQRMWVCWESVSAMKTKRWRCPVARALTCKDMRGGNQRGPRRENAFGPNSTIRIFSNVFKCSKFKANWCLLNLLWSRYCVDIRNPCQRH